MMELPLNLAGPLGVILIHYMKALSRGRYGAGAYVPRVPVE
jgi:hypothetical protein